MEKVISIDDNGLHITDNDDLLASVLADLANSNTAFPEIVDIYEFKKTVKLQEYDKKTGKRRTEIRNAMRVYFADGTWTDVVKSNEDKNDPVVGLLYAIVKRLMGTLTEGGYVHGGGFMNRIKKYLANARNEETEKKAKEERIAKKVEEDKKAHEEAVLRHEKHPSLGYRLRNLEDKFNTLLDTLGGGSVKSVKTNDKKDSDKQPRQKNGRFARFIPHGHRN